MTKDNRVLGKFDLTGIRPAPRGVPQIEVTFAIDANGILEVTATDKETGESNNLQINADKQTMSQEEIDEALARAAEFEDEDRAKRDQFEAKNKLEGLMARWTRKWATRSWLRCCPTRTRRHSKRR